MTGKGLDRETAGWHNITVLAMEAGELGGVSGGAVAGSELRLNCQSRHMGEESRVEAGQSSYLGIGVGGIRSPGRKV